jgi:hypothetical protein
MASAFDESKLLAFSHNLMRKRALEKTENENS